MNKTDTETLLQIEQAIIVSGHQDRLHNNNNEH